MKKASPAKPKKAAAKSSKKDAPKKAAAKKVADVASATETPIGDRPKDPPVNG
jgi:hypothetical protein